MGRVLKILLFLVVAGFTGLVGFAYLGDLAPARETVTQPLTLDVD